MKLRAKLLLATTATALAVLGLAEWLSYRQMATMLRQHEALMLERVDHPELLESLQTEKRKLSTTLVWIHAFHAGAVIIGLLLVLSFMWNRLVVRRLQILLRHIHWMERGAWTQIAPVYNDDEIGQLTRAFNVLGEQLSTTLNQSTGAAKLAGMALLGQRLVRRVGIALDQLYAVTAVLKLKSICEERQPDTIADNLTVIIRILEQVPVEFEGEFDRQFREHSVLPPRETEPHSRVDATVASGGHDRNGTAGAGHWHEVKKDRS